MCVSAMCLCQSQATTTHALSVAASLLQGGQDKEVVVGLLRQLAPLYNKLYDAAKAAMMPLPGGRQAGGSAAVALLGCREGQAAKPACHHAL